MAPKKWWKHLERKVEVKVKIKIKIKIKTVSSSSLLEILA